MDGPEIIVATLSGAAIADRHGNQWQYLSRSDHHSKSACWAILVDLLQESATLRSHATSGAVTLGLNHEMREFRTNRRKRLDFVIATPGTPTSRPRSERFVDMADRYGIALNPKQRDILEPLAEIRSGPVAGSVLSYQQMIRRAASLYDSRFR